MSCEKYVFKGMICRNCGKKDNYVKENEISFFRDEYNYVVDSFSFKCECCKKYINFELKNVESSQFLPECVRERVSRRWSKLRVYVKCCKGFFGYLDPKTVKTRIIKIICFNTDMFEFESKCEVCSKIQYVFISRKREYSLYSSIIKYIRNRDLKNNTEDTICLGFI